MFNIYKMAEKFGKQSDTLTLRQNICNMYTPENNQQNDCYRGLFSPPASF